MSSRILGGFIIGVAIRKTNDKLLADKNEALSLGLSEEHKKLNSLAVQLLVFN